jgi:hypothetical protein
MVQVNKSIITLKLQHNGFGREVEEEIRKSLKVAVYLDATQYDSGWETLTRSMFSGEQLKHLNALFACYVFWQSNPTLGELHGVQLRKNIANSQVLAGWRHECAWISAAVILAADINLSTHPLRSSLDSLQPLICQFAGINYIVLGTCTYPNIVLIFCCMRLSWTLGAGADTRGFASLKFAEKSTSMGLRQLPPSPPRAVLTPAPAPTQALKRRKIMHVAPPLRGWVCAQCTFVNHEFLPVCEMCAVGTAPVQPEGPGMYAHVPGYVRMRTGQGR